MTKRKADGVATPLVLAATAIMERLDPDPAHARQVTRLALRLFDELAGEHRLTEHERGILEAAGLLHDTGWSRTLSGKHHKHSRDIILESDLPGLGKRDRTVCALTARYHRRAEPDPRRHRSLDGLSAKERNAVEWLAAILRVADGLDRSHADCVRDLRCRVSGSRIDLRIEACEQYRTEIWGAMQKAGLLMRKTGKDLVIKRC